MPPSQHSKQTASSWMGEQLELPEPGIEGYAPELVQAVNRSPTLNGWQVDGSLVAVFLLALMVRSGGVILDVVNGRHGPIAAGIGHTSRVAVALASSVFGLGTRAIHLHSTSSVAEVALGTPPGAIIITGLEDAPTPVQIKLRSEIARVETRDGGPLLIWIRDDQRRDEPSTPLWLLDLFACSAPVYPDDLESPPIGLRPTALIPEEYIADLRLLLLLTHIHPPLEAHIANLVAALALHPTLAGGLSSRATSTLTELVRGQRLLAADFYLPPDWKSALDEWRAVQCSESGRFDMSSSPEARGGLGFAGGPGGVVTWGRKAGETPTAEAMLGEGAEDWYCLPRNVAGAWELAIRHRVRARRPGESALYALNGSAQDRVQHMRRPEDAHTVREESRQRKAIVDEALHQILLSV